VPDQADHAPQQLTVGGPIRFEIYDPGDSAHFFALFGFLGLLGNLGFNTATGPGEERFLDSQRFIRQDRQDC
jgi:hypothetical protein